MILGYLKVSEYLRKVEGKVMGNVITDAKNRIYHREYNFVENGDVITVQRRDGNGDVVSIPNIIPLDESLIAFFGLYSGDGAKGSEDKNNVGRILPNVSFSQKEKHLVRFAVDQFHRLFPGNIRITFSLGEDSAYFMDGIGKDRLTKYYLENGHDALPPLKNLSEVRPKLNDKDLQYLSEVRPDVIGTNEEHLAFYYQHQKAMQNIFIIEKANELKSVGIVLTKNDRVTASLRRPFKKGARQPGGSSRSDEIHLGGLNGIGELFLKMMHEVEESILRDVKVSSQGLVHWNDIPSSVGNTIDIYDFYTNNNYGIINKERPKQLKIVDGILIGQWRRSNEIKLKSKVRLDALWCYVAGLYLAEGSTPKEALFNMFRQSPGALSLGFTSSEGASLELMLRTLRKVFYPEDCITAWKVKVGSQYFPELVVTGLKHGVSMLRGGASGDGKLRTIEISLAIKTWALSVADTPLTHKSLLASEYSHLYSHVEPTGSGVARIDFWASSTLCRWYFPILMYTVFGNITNNPRELFYDLLEGVPNK